MCEINPQENAIKGKGWKRGENELSLFVLDAHVCAVCIEKVDRAHNLDRGDHHFHTSHGSGIRSVLFGTGLP